MVAAFWVIAGLLPFAHARLSEAVRRAEKAEVALVLSDHRWPKVMDTIARWEKLPRPVRVRLAMELRPALHTTAFVRPTNTADLMVPYRIRTGELKHVGLGLHVRQDVFLSGGRAAFAIERLTGADDFPTLDGGLTPGEWNGRALAIEAKVKAFANAPAKPVARVLWRGERPGPHPFPAARGVLAMAPLLAPGSGPWRVPKVVLLVEAQWVEEFLTDRDWPRIRELTQEWDGLPADVRTRLAERLLPRLREMRSVPLKRTDGLEIPYRVKTGEMKPAPDKFVTEHDLFLVGGRASWAIYYLTGGGGTIPLHGGLTVDEWNKRAKQVETYVKKFVAENTPKK